MAISSVTQSPVAAAGDGGQVHAPPPSAAPVLPAAQATGTAAARPAPTPEQVAQAVKRVNEAFVQMGQNLFASIEKDQTTGISVVKFQDRNTKEVVSQYPSKAIIAVAEALDQSPGMKGRLLNVRA